MCRKLIISIAAPMLLLGSCSAFAVKPVDLNHQPVSILKPLLGKVSAAALSGTAGVGKVDQVVELSRSEDFNHTTHIRVQQLYAGVPVIGADSSVHVKNSKNNKRALASVVDSANASNVTMTGMIYQDLSAALPLKPAQVKGNEAQAVNEAITLSHKDFNTVAEPQHKSSQLSVYVDDKNNAHYVFQVKLQFDQNLKTPVYILDAQTMAVYESWNDTKTLSDALGGGFGGNEKMGRLVYDGLAGHLGRLAIKRDDENKICFLENSEVTVMDGRHHEVAQYKCDTLSFDHGNTYWAGDVDQVNGGYSPSNDALYVGSVVKEMYLKWYHTPMLLDENKQPMMLEMTSHSPNLERPFNNDWENAVWYAEKIYLGDGADEMYPLTSLGVIAHEISHGFTEQHSNLQYKAQSGGMNESFSDMAAQAAEFYAYGKSSWMIGSEIVKQSNSALRYMQKPSDDCTKNDMPHPDPKHPGKMTARTCSIDHVKDFEKDMNVHYTSGIFNRLFYLMSTAEGWDVKKAFGVMLQANAQYWHSRDTYQKAACGVVLATKDFGYDMAAVTTALKEVGLTDQGC